MAQKVLLRPGGAAAPGAPSAPGVRGPRKLLNELLEPTIDEIAPLLSDSADFTVVGVLGAQGVGKSTILSLLAGAPLIDANEVHGGRAGVLLHEPIFPPAEPGVLRAAHQTVGSDLHVTAERLILLDTPPPPSPSSPDTTPTPSAATGTMIELRTVHSMSPGVRSSGFRCACTNHGGQQLALRTSLLLRPRLQPQRRPPVDHRHHPRHSRRSPRAPSTATKTMPSTCSSSTTISTTARCGRRIIASRATTA